MGEFEISIFRVRLEMFDIYSCLKGYSVLYSLIYFLCPKQQILLSCVQNYVSFHL